MKSEEETLSCVPKRHASASSSTTCEPHTVNPAPHTSHIVPHILQPSLYPAPYTYTLHLNLNPESAEIGILLPINQRQHRTSHIQKDVLPYALC